MFLKVIGILGFIILVYLACNSIIKLIRAYED